MIRGKNPETVITEQIRNLLRLLRVPHWKNFGGPMGERGVSDIIGCIPGGKALFIEVKTTTGSVSSEQAEFLQRFKAAGAIAFVARSPQDVIAALAEANYGPALQIKAQFVRKP